MKKASTIFKNMRIFAALKNYQTTIKKQKEMKKIFGILAVSAFLFASCGGNAENTEAVDTTAAPVEEVVVEEAPVADTTAVAEEAATEATEEVAA